MQSVELLLDPGLDAAVRSEWAALVLAGLPSQARHKGPTNAPHVTLGVASSISPSVDATLAAAGSFPLPLRLGPVAVFGRPPRLILVRLVVPTAALLSLHASVADALADSPGSDLPHLTPGTWTPHVTLARALPPTSLAAALEALAPVDDLTGTAVNTRRWDGDARRAWLL